MEDHFVIIHQIKQSSDEKASVELLAEPLFDVNLFESLRKESLKSDSLLWELSTCLRSITLYKSDFYESHLSHLVKKSQSNFPGSIEIYEKEKAYRFLLEVICGLHSPIVGETEVMGQFKGSIKELKKKNEDSLFNYFQSLLTDAKKIRTEHLTNIGAQSYGSLCRKALESSRSVHLLGAGKLTKDLLPWFVEFPSVEVYCRNLNKGAPLKEAFPKVEIMNWNLKESEFGVELGDGDSFLSDSEKNQESLVIAATITNDELKEWLYVHGHSFKKVIDLRGEEPFPHELFSENKFVKTEVITLSELFKSVKNNQSEMTLKVKIVKEEITKLAQKFSSKNEVINRPLGWDEICA